MIVVIVIIACFLLLSSIGVAVYFVFFNKKKDDKKDKTPSPAPSPTQGPTQGPARATSKKYPPVALTGLATTISGQTYGNGSYTCSVSASYFGANNAVDLFNKNIDGNWHSPCTYNGATGVYNGSVSTIAGSTTHTGEWAQITLPSAIRLSKFTLGSSKGNGPPDPQQKSPRAFVVLGSNDLGVTWNAIHTEPDYKSWGVNAEIKTFTISGSPAAYSTYRLVVSKTGVLDSYGSGDKSCLFLTEWELFEN